MGKYQAKWAYYNEIDPFCVAWLKNLIRKGSLPDGVVDHRSIVDVQPEEINDFHEVHLFAGIGLWARALKMAFFPPEISVITGSCPCQPYSVAGKQSAEADKRALWPEMRRLVASSPHTMAFGEQVGGNLGYRWLSGVRSDLEGLGFAFGAADLPAACVGAPHVRQRLYWGAYRLANCDAARLQIQRYGELLTARREQEGGATQSSRWDTHSPWGWYWEEFPDGTIRRSQPGLRIVADAGRSTTRVGRIRAYGNAISPWTASRFIESFTISCE